MEFIKSQMLGEVVESTKKDIFTEDQGFKFKKNEYTLSPAIWNVINDLIKEFSGALRGKRKI